MSKGFRVFLHLLQALSLLGAIWYLSFSFRNAYFDFGLSDGEIQHLNTWIVGLTVLSIALSPQLWSSVRSKSPYAAPDEGFERAGSAPAAPVQPGGMYEPMNAGQAPAPPASSYGQPSAGGITPASSPQAGSPWGSGR